MPKEGGKKKTLKTLGLVKVWLEMQEWVWEMQEWVREMEVG
jgi:hypothetical protein